MSKPCRCKQGSATLHCLIPQPDFKFLAIQMPAMARSVAQKIDFAQLLRTPTGLIPIVRQVTLFFEFIEQTHISKQWICRGWERLTRSGFWYRVAVNHQG